MEEEMITRNSIGELLREVLERLEKAQSAIWSPACDCRDTADIRLKAGASVDAAVDEVRRQIHKCSMSEQSY